MPRVPTYESQGLQPTIRQGEVRQVITTEQATLPGRQLQEVGETMGRVGSALGQYVLQRQNEYNETKATEAFNDIASILQTNSTAFGNERGRSAIDNVERFNTEATSGVSRVLDALPNPVIRALVEPRANAALSLALDRNNRHLLAEARTYQDQLDQSIIAQAAQSAIADPAPANMETQTQAIAEAIRGRDRRAGVDQATTDLNIQNAHSELAVGAVNALLARNDIPGAERVLQEYQGLFQPNALADTQNTVREAGAVFYGRQDADKVLQEFPVVYNDSSRSARIARARELATVNGVLDEGRFNAARIIVSAAESDQLQDIAATMSATYDRLYGLTMTNPSQALREIATSGLPPQMRRTLTLSAEYTAGGGSARGGGGGGGRGTPTPRELGTEEQFRAYELFMDENEENLGLTELTTEEINDISVLIGPGLTRVLRDIREQQFETRRLGDNASIDAFTLNRLMDDLGISEQEQDRFAMVARSVVGQRQQALGATMTDEQKYNAVVGHFGQGGPRVQYGPRRGFFAGPESAPLGFLTEEEEGQVVVPARERGRLTAVIESYGVPVTQARIRAAYIEELRTGVPAQPASEAD